MQGLTPGRQNASQCSCALPSETLHASDRVPRRDAVSRTNAATKAHAARLITVAAPRPGRAVESKRRRREATRQRLPPGAAVESRCMTRAEPGELVVADPGPAYLEPQVRDSLPQRVAKAVELLRCCRTCPRECKVDRLAGQTGVCRTGRHAIVSSAFAHHGEEDCLRGWRGSGTIFFSMCNLGCIFCQNWDISHRPSGEAMDAAALADVMLALQSDGCHNINLVTPTHVAPQIVEGLALAIERGLHLPVVYNTGAYDALDTLRLMEGLVDVYMPDFKFWSAETAQRLAHAADYPDRAREAIREMHRQVGVLKFTPDGLACRGVLVRHLVMPGQGEESRAIFRWLAEELSRDTYVNIMAQYCPTRAVGHSAGVGVDGGPTSYADIDRRPTSSEIEAAYHAAREAGLWRFDGRAAVKRSE